MTREETKAHLLATGARIVHEKGFNNTGIQEILLAAGVPKGSFYFYFKSKEDFGLALVDYYLEGMKQWMEKHLASPGDAPLDALKAFFGEFTALFLERGCKAGCPVGNICQEMADLNQAFRAKVEHCFSMMKENIAIPLRIARERGDIDQALDPDLTAQFMVNSWEGALLRMKAQNSIEPLVLFQAMVFERLLR